MSRFFTVSTLATHWLRAAACVLFATGLHCDSLYGALGTDNLNNCVRNADLCQGPDVACNPFSKLCEPALRLDAVSPRAGSNGGGDTLTITGRNFAPDLQVRFDGQLAESVVVQPGGGQLTVVVPAHPGVQGPVAVELVQPQGQQARRGGLFSYYSPLQFERLKIAGTHSLDTPIASDVNGDGKLDLIAVESAAAGGGQVEVYLGHGDGTLTSTKISPLANVSNAVAAGDLNGDGHLDLGVSERANGMIEILLGDASGGFTQKLLITASFSLGELLLCDINGDGKLDLVVDNGGSLLVRMGDGTGDFAPQKTFPLSNSGNLNALIAADLDGDGHVELLMASRSDHVINLLRGPGDGTFSPAQQVASLPWSPTRLVVGDLDGDGKLDVMTASASVGPGKQQLAQLLGRGDGSFADPLFTETNNAVSWLEVHDLNGDGHPDVVALSPTANAVNCSSFAGLGDGLLAPPSLLNGGLTPSGLLVADYTGDGKPDLLVPNNNELYLFRNITQ